MKPPCLDEVSGAETPDPALCRFRKRLSAFLWVLARNLVRVTYRGVLVLIGFSGFYQNLCVVTAVLKMYSACG